MRIGAKTSLRHAINLITISALAARRRKADVVDVVDVRRVYGLFIDEKRSVAYLQDHAREFMMDEGGSGIDGQAILLGTATNGSSTATATATATAA